MTGVLRASVARKDFQNRRVLENVDLTVFEREVVSLVGQSGCGKSTLLRIIAGLERDYDGTVELDRRPLRGVTRHIGFVFQEPRLLPWLTVAENVAFGGEKPRAADGRVESLLKEVGLEGYAGALPKRLSGGQAQRVAIARGLFASPRVLLLDEPFSAVDAFTRMTLQDLLLKVAGRRETTLVLVTHDVDEAVFLSHRVLIMGAEPGSIRAQVTVDAPAPRDRRDPRLAALKARVLTQLMQARAL